MKKLKVKLIQIVKEEIEKLKNREIGYHCLDNNQIVTSILILKSGIDSGAILNKKTGTIIKNHIRIEKTKESTEKENS